MTFWRPEDPEFDSTGVCTRGGMFQHQRDWWNLDAFVRVLVTGYGGGKSEVGCKWAIPFALENAPVPFALISPTFELARETTVRTMEMLLDGKASVLNKPGSPPVFDWTHNKNSKLFRIFYKGRIAEIVYLSGEDPDKIKGHNLCGAFLDEPFVMDQKVFTNTMSRVRHPKAKRRAVGLGGTPEGLGWGYELVEGDLRADIEESLADVPHPYADGVGVVRATSRDNLALPPEYVKMLIATLGEKEAKSYVDGVFVNLSGGMVYYAFDRSEHQVRITIPKGAELGAGIDFNVDPMSACVFWHHRGHMHFFDEIELRNSDTQELAAELREKYWEFGLRDVYPDASGAARKTSAPGGRSDYHYLREAGFTINARPSNPHRRDRYNAVNGRFKPRDGITALTIDPRCKKLPRYLMTYTYEGLNKADHKAMSHLLDAFSYPIAYLYPVDQLRVHEVRLRGA